MIELPGGKMSKQATFFDPRGAPLILWGVPLLFLLASAFLSSRISLYQERVLAEREDRERAGNQSLLYEISRHPAFSFGFRNFFADFSWLGAVQVAGTRKLTPTDYDRFACMFQTVVEFGPNFKVPYLLGGGILGDSRAHPQEAPKILTLGRANHPDDGGSPFYTGYLHYFSLGDPAEG